MGLQNGNQQKIWNKVVRKEKIMKVKCPNYPGIMASLLPCYFSSWSLAELMKRNGRSDRRWTGEARGNKWQRATRNGRPLSSSRDLPGLASREARSSPQRDGAIALNFSWAWCCALTCLHSACQRSVPLVVSSLESSLLLGFRTRGQSLR